MATATIVVAQAYETDTAQPITSNVVIIGQVVETDMAIAFVFPSSNPHRVLHRESFLVTRREK